MNKQQRTMIVVVAIAIFFWFNLATYWWVNSFASVTIAINRTWQAIVSNWMILIIISDSFFFMVLIFVWLLKDARRRGWTGYKRWGWIVALLALGSPALLLYLVLRPGKPSSLAVTSAAAAVTAIEVQHLTRSRCLSLRHQHRIDPV